MARHVAKNIVAAGLADRCEVQLAYAIGVSEPVSVLVDTEGTGKIADEKLCELVRKVFPLDARAGSSSISTSAGRSIARRPPAGISAATSRSSPGKAPTAPPNWPKPRDCEIKSFEHRITARTIVSVLIILNKCITFALFFGKIGKI